MDPGPRPSNIFDLVEESDFWIEVDDSEISSLTDARLRTPPVTEEKKNVASKADTSTSFDSLSKRRRSLSKLHPGAVTTERIRAASLLTDFQKDLPVFAQYSDDKWYEAKMLSERILLNGMKQIFVHYTGWGSRFDQYLLMASLRLPSTKLGNTFFGSFHIRAARDCNLNQRVSTGTNAESSLQHSPIGFEIDRLEIIARRSKKIQLAESLADHNYAKGIGDRRDSKLTFTNTRSLKADDSISTAADAEDEYMDDDDNEDDGRDCILSNDFVYEEPDDIVNNNKRG